MNDTTTVPIMEHEQVKELLSILHDNGKDASDFAYLLGYVTSMESQLNKAVDELAAMRRDLSEMREERDHPLKTAMQNAAHSLDVRINEAREQLDQLKAKIADGCKSAVSAFREKGVTALNGIVGFFRIKPALEALRDSVQGSIWANHAAIDKVEAMSAEYHAAGRHLKNIGRALRGKEPLEGIKPNGKLAKLIENPFRSQLRYLNTSLRDVNKAIAAIERLESRSAKETVVEDLDDKPSVRETMKTLKSKLEQEKPAPAAEKPKQKEAAL